MTKQELQKRVCITDGSTKLNFLVHLRCWMFKILTGAFTWKYFFANNIVLEGLFLNPGCIWEILIRKRTSILEKGCFNYEQLFNPIYCTACKICQGRLKDKLFLSRLPGILSTSDQPHYLWGMKCFGSGTRQNSNCLYQSWSSDLLFSYHYVLSTSGKKFFLWNLSFQCLATTVGVSFSREIFGTLSTTW